MEKIKADLSNLDAFFAKYPAASAAKAKTLFYKKLSLATHKFYGGKMETFPKVSLPSQDWLNAWYTPGVSAVSTAIRDNNQTSFELTNRKNLVAVVSDSTRVLGDGDCTPPGGLGVMEGKSFLMKYLGGVDAIALCIDSKDETGKNNPQKIIDFVLTCQHSFGAVNLEDISQPNCYRVLDALRAKAQIPVWHDDAQGTATIICAGLINALKLAGKKIENIKIVLFGSGAANTTICSFLEQMGARAGSIIMTDSKGPIHKNRKDLEANPNYYKQWGLAQKTNAALVPDLQSAFKNADVVIALSKPGPDVVKPEWVKSMADKAIVFACANPVPEIYPYAAKEAGAFITATGRGDFENQLNNSVCFPGILKGALLCGAKTITDAMAISAARAIAGFAEKRGITPSDIAPKMSETEIFPAVAAAVAAQAAKDGVAVSKLTEKEVYNLAKKDIEDAQKKYEFLQREGFIPAPPQEILEKVLKDALAEI